MLSIVVPSAVAGAQDVTGDDWLEMLRQSEAGGALPEVSTVDGRPVDPELLVSPAHQADRITTARGGTFGDPVDAADLRARATEIVSLARYTPETEGAIRSFFNRLADTAIVNWFQDVWNRIVEWFRSFFDDGDTARRPRSGDADRESFGIPLLVVVGAIGLFVGIFLARRRVAADGRQRRVGTAMWPELDGADSDSLGRMAEQAEASGDFERAVRLRFLAGLLTLDDLEAIEFDPAMRTNHLRSEVGIGTFDTVADDFERVTYSTRGAGPAEADAARSGWDEIVRRAAAEVRERADD